MSVIRRMTESDIPFLTKIAASNYSKRFAEQFVVEALCAFMPFPFRPHFIVAELDGQPVGCACWMSDWISWGVFNISWVQVAPDHQRNGIGRALVDACLDELRPQAGLVLLATQSPHYYARYWDFKRLLDYRANEDDDYVLMSLALIEQPQVTAALPLQEPKP